MKYRFGVLTILSVGMAAFVAPVSAHHSFAAEFDGSKAIRLVGKLTKVDWSNPHTYFYLDVKDDRGKVVNWACEGGGPGALSRRGLTSAQSWGQSQSVARSASFLRAGAFGAGDGSAKIEARPFGGGVTGNTAGTGQLLKVRVLLPENGRHAGSPDMSLMRPHRLVAKDTTLSR